ncbi:unnamed protein product [Prorocentrum cordatum]|uniref:Uncharacterized protein n=1 Tax=Prorocentrum cordatum TaxID=2364126 RepID=A0ABN9R9D9_9DINO|nr:unnamed protein product [Polarella glacialis]
MHASCGCGADALPQTGAAARRLQRGGTRVNAKKVKEAKQQEVPRHAAAPVSDGLTAVDGLLECLRVQVEGIQAFLPDSHFVDHMHAAAPLEPLALVRVRRRIDVACKIVALLREASGRRIRLSTTPAPRRSS